MHEMNLKGFKRTNKLFNIYLLTYRKYCQMALSIGLIYDG